MGYSEPLRTTLINSLIIEGGYSSYLEIGVSKPYRNFDLIKIFSKTGIDPTPKREDILGLSSDEYFKKIEKGKKFDLIFIDGLHHADQVLRDLRNSLKHLNKGGTIVCHDLLPKNEREQLVPQSVSSWTGDCWKAWAYLRMTRVDLSMAVIDEDHGVGILVRGRQDLFPIRKLPEEMDYKFFSENRKTLMNIIEI